MKNLNETVEMLYYSQEQNDFNASIERMRRKASKGLTEYSEKELDETIENIFKEDKEFEKLEEELDEAVNKF